MERGKSSARDTGGDGQSTGMVEGASVDGVLHSVQYSVRYFFCTSVGPGPPAVVCTVLCSSGYCPGPRLKKYCTLVEYRGWWICGLISRGRGGRGGASRVRSEDGGQDGKIGNEKEC